MRRATAILALLPFLMLLHSAKAKELPTLSVRELTLHAETILLAEPLETPSAPTRFKVLEVLRGDGLKPGNTLTVDPGSHPLPIHEWAKRPANEPQPPAVEQALLFLGPNCGTHTQPRFEPIASGLRLWRRDRSLLVPVPKGNPGGPCLQEWQDFDWANLVRQTRADAEVVNALFARKKLRPIGRRNRALLGWIEGHRYEFGADGRGASRKDDARLGPSGNGRFSMGVR